MVYKQTFLCAYNHYNTFNIVKYSNIMVGHASIAQSYMFHVIYILASGSTFRKYLRWPPDMSTLFVLIQYSLRTRNDELVILPLLVNLF